MALIFLDCQNTCDLQDNPASIYDINAAARRFDTIQDIQRFLKGTNAPFWHIGNQRVKT